MAVMVWCNSCKKVAWALDHQPRTHLSSICNILKLPCPKCGTFGNYNGWESDNAYQQVTEAIIAKEIVEGSTSKDQVYDDWSAMKHIALLYKVEWAPSGDNVWFDPYHSQLIKAFLRDKVAFVRTAPLEEVFPKE